MASLMKKIKRKKINAREFQVTASVTALTLECLKGSW